MVQHSSIDHTDLITAVTSLSFGSNSNSVAIANAPGASPSNSHADHVHLGVTSVAHTSNTFSGPVTVVAGANIGITSPASGTLTISGAAAGGGGDSHTHTTVDATLSGDVTMTTGGTWYDGPSDSFAAGTWHVNWKALIVQGSAGQRSFVGRLTDSGVTTEYDYSEMAPPNANGFRTEIVGFAIVVLGSTTTLKVQARSDVNTNTMSRNGGGGTGNFATRLSAVKVA